MILNNEIQNFMIDCYLLPADQLKISAHNLPLQDHEVDAYVEFARENKISSYLFLQLEKLKADEKLLGQLRQSYEAIKKRNTVRLQTGLPVLLEMQKRGIEVIILKGNAIAHEMYGDIGYKPMNDIDILIKKEDLEKTLEVFKQFSLLSAAPLEEDVKKQSKMSHHAPPFFDKKMDVFFGTHWNIAAPTRGLKIPLDEFWSEKESFQLNGHRCYRLAPIHFLFHLCVHLNAAKTGLREVADLVKVIQYREREIDSNRLIKMARNSGASEEVYEALSLVKSLIQFKLVDEVLVELKKDLQDSVIARISKRTSSRLKILHLRTNYISKIEKTFAFFMMSEDPLEKTVLLGKMWKYYLFVPVETALKLNYEFQDVSLLSKCKAVLIAPAKISRVFIKDLGPFIFIFVTLRHQWVLAKSYSEFILKFFQGKKIKRLKDFAEDLGLTIDEIKELQALD